MKSFKFKAEYRGLKESLLERTSFHNFGHLTTTDHVANILLLDKFLICIRFMTHTSGIIVTCQCRSHRATFWMKNERRKSRNYRFQLAGMWWISLSMVKMICKMKFSSRLSQKKEVIFFKIQYTLPTATPTRLILWIPEAMLRSEFSSMSNTENPFSHPNKMNFESPTRSGEEHTTGLIT